MMLFLKHKPLRNRPIAAGLLWAAMFVPLFLLLSLGMGNPVHGWGLLFLTVIAIPAGLIWSFTVHRIVRKRG